MKLDIVYQNRYWFKTVLAGNVGVCKLCDFKNGGCLRILIAAQQPLATAL